MREVRPPDSLASVRYVVIVYVPEDATYSMALPDGDSYNLGGGIEALNYLRRATENIRGLPQDFAERCLDVAFNFVASLCVISYQDCVVGDVIIFEDYRPGKSEVELMMEAGVIDMTPHPHDTFGMNTNFDIWSV